MPMLNFESMLKHILAYFTIFLILNSCNEGSKEESLSKEEAIEVHDLTPQDFTQKKYVTYTLHSEKDTILQCEGGTKLLFVKGSFLRKKDGKLYQGKIVLHVAEFYSIDDMILSNLSTKHINGMVLESSGMINIKAFGNNEELILNSSVSDSIEFSGTAKEHSTIFSGIEQEHDVKWKGRCKSWLVATDHDGNQYILATAPNYGRDNLFKLDTLGWINLDRLKSFDSTQRLEVNHGLKDVSNITLKCVLKNFNVLLSGRLGRANHKLDFEAIPINEPLYIVLIQYDGEVMNYAIHYLESANGIKSIDVEFKRSDLKSVQEELRKIFPKPVNAS